jgi:hypothetical protein
MMAIISGCHIELRLVRHADLQQALDVAGSTALLELRCYHLFLDATIRYPMPIGWVLLGDAYLGILLGYTVGLSGMEMWIGGNQGSGSGGTILMREVWYGFQGVSATSMPREPQWCTMSRFTRSQ